MLRRSSSSVMQHRLAILSFLGLAFVVTGAARVRAQSDEVASESESEVASESESESAGEGEGAAPAPVEEAAPVDEGEAPPSDGSFDLPVFGRTTFSMTSTTTARYRGNNYNS